MDGYNSGAAYPYIYKVIGRVKWQTIEGWKQKISNAGGDPFALVDTRGASIRGQRSINPDQAACLIAVLRSNLKKKSEIITTAKMIMAQRGIEDGLSDHTYRRWINEWIEMHWDKWVWPRWGNAGLDNQCTPYAIRDYDAINVGDIAVADGHVLNFNILNPWTGKPKRMSLVAWYDMISNYVLGWEIMPTENIQSIHAALRRGIMVLGKIPVCAYLDNGRAFRAKIFTQTCNDIDFKEAGVLGLYQRLGIQTIFARPYHGQAKTIERFFQTFGQIERLGHSYTGTSIEEKPPHMHMGEKLHRKLHKTITGGAVPTLEQAHVAVSSWFDAYHRTEQGKNSHIAGRCPLDVFEEGRGPGVDETRLRILMMSQNVKTIRRNGIWHAGGWYYSRELYGRKHKAIYLYDYHHMDSILVFEENGKPICEAARMGGLHPAARILGSTEDQERLSDFLEMQGSLRKQTVSSAKAFAERVVIPETRKRLETLGLVSPDGKLLPAPENKRVPGKLSAAEEEKILADADRIQADTESIRTECADEPICLPEVEDASAAFWSGLDAMSDMDRYEAVVTAEVRRWLVPKQWQAFRAYYEQTPEYDRHAEYWDAHRLKETMTYCTN
uniref:Putative transposase n=1 Tax=viral metagenome TaxID=1070528 RepID=A0A6M3KRP9_9ZZZZ